MNAAPAITQPVLRITPRAAEELQSLLTQPDNAGKCFRVFVEKGGCSGMQYGMVFDEPRAADLQTDTQGVRLLVDPISADYVRGAVVDFSDALSGGGFKITNPNARQSCGCGKSFET